MQKYDIAAYIWPAYTGTEPRTRIFWPEGFGEWQTVKAAGSKFEGHSWPRKPLWGYVDEADPFVMEMEIEAAVSHGVNVFIYDWYWYDQRPFLETCLNDGFLKARNNKKMKFYLMWANHDATDVWDKRNAEQGTIIWKGAVALDEFKKIGRRWIERYMCLDNYYRIGGKPVISIYDLKNFIDGIGGMQTAKEALGWLDAEAEKAGLGGIHFQYIKWGDNNLNLSGVDGGEKKVSLSDIVSLGFESATHYQFVHFADVRKDYGLLSEDLKKEWDNIDKNLNITFFPHVSIGWDNNPRYNSFREHIAVNNTPENFSRLLMQAKEYIDSHNIHPLITVNSWNEWTETSYLEPDNIYGYGYLEAIKNIFLK
ncbi:MAG: glycoside hydrolase family 99-like domain-containing protein [Clostridia bacterium]|nr:glycoside hydrolase family 99-like domain-containing protein [Clostridia bacterium]